MRYDEPAQITLWGPTNLQTPALKPILDALPISLKDPSGAVPTLSEILQLPVRNFSTGIGNPTLTLMAYAMRLSDHLKTELARTA